jgi:multicomponent K+:H+ antiporter subunit E
MKRWLPHPVLSILLFVTWLLLSADLSLAHIVLAAILAWVIPYVSRSFLVGLPPIKNPWAALRLLFVVTYDIVVANVVVARLILRSPKKLRPLFVEMPIALTQSMSISLLASIITMTPGTVSAELTDDNRILIIHALDCADPSGLIADIQNRYEKPLMEIFGC